MDGVKRSCLEIMGQRKVNMAKIRHVFTETPSLTSDIDRQVEIDAHYQGYLLRQSQDIATFNKDESFLIPDDINYDSLSGLSNEIKFKLKKIKPSTLGQALRIDGVTPAAVIILLSYIKRRKHRVSA